MRNLALGLVALTFASSAALAQTPITFAQVDVDGDGRLSFAELQSVWPDLTQQEFASVDTEGLGSITPAQLDTLQPSALGTGATAATNTNDGVLLGPGAGELEFPQGVSGAGQVDPVTPPSNESLTESDDNDSEDDGN